MKREREELRRGGKERENVGDGLREVDRDKRRRAKEREGGRGENDTGRKAGEQENNKTRGE